MSDDAAFIRRKLTDPKPDSCSMSPCCILSLEHASIRRQVSVLLSRSNSLCKSSFQCERSLATSSHLSMYISIGLMSLFQASLKWRCGRPLAFLPVARYRNRRTFRIIPISCFPCFSVAVRWCWSFPFQGASLGRVLWDIGGCPCSMSTLITPSMLSF